MTNTDMIQCRGCEQWYPYGIQHTCPPIAAEALHVQTFLDERFAELVSQWQERVGHLSSITQRVADPAYLDIIALGPDAVPLLLKELQRNPNHWFPALRALTKADPVKPEQRGKIKEMAGAWISWGRQHGHLPNIHTKD